MGSFVEPSEPVPLCVGTTFARASVSTSRADDDTQSAETFTGSYESPYSPAAKLMPKVMPISASPGDAGAAGGVGVGAGGVGVGGGGVGAGGGEAGAGAGAAAAGCAGDAIALAGVGGARKLDAANRGRLRNLERLSVSFMG